MSESAEGSASRVKPNAPIWIKFFVAFHLLSITVWALPLASPDLKTGTVRPRGSDEALLFNDRYLRPSPIKFYLLETGFWQYWDMFAPNPSGVDIWCDAKVTYKDGAVKAYQYPRMALLPVGEKFIKERYRKFYERVSLPEHSFLWPTFAQRIALINDGTALNPPVQVQLFHHWLRVPGPGETVETEYSKRLFFTYEVDQGALAKARVEGP